MEALARIWKNDWSQFVFYVKPLILNCFFYCLDTESECVGVSDPSHCDEPTDQCFFVTVSS